MGNRLLNELRPVGYIVWRQAPNLTPLTCSIHRSPAGGANQNWQKLGSLGMHAGDDRVIFLPSPLPLEPLNLAPIERHSHPADPELLHEIGRERIVTNTVEVLK